MVALLVARGATVNLCMGHGGTSLHTAVIHEATSAVKELLAKGADPCLPDADGQSAIELAEQRALPDILSQLVRAAVQQQVDASMRYSGRRQQVCPFFQGLRRAVVACRWARAAVWTLSDVLIRRHHVRGPVRYLSMCAGSRGGAKAKQWQSSCHRQLNRCDRKFHACPVPKSREHNFARTLCSMLAQAFGQFLCFPRQ